MPDENYDVVTITLYDQLGPAHSIFMVVLIIMILTLLSLGFIRRSRKTHISKIEWFLRNGSVWIALFGAFTHAISWQHHWLMYGGVGMDPQKYSELVAEIYAKTTIYLLIALVGWAFSMILSATNKNNFANQGMDFTGKTPVD